jgi:ABC-type molybdate transport system ATPase subunit
VPDLVIKRLTVTRGGRRILGDCDAVLPGRRRTVLWGWNGSGKSTLLAAIAGLITPDAGEIRFGDQVFHSVDAAIDIPPHQRHIGMVFQDLALWPHLSASEQVTLVGQAAGLNGDGVTALLESLGLEHLRDRRPSQLSGGEQQRLAIARALAAKPAILLLDEPFSSADLNTRESLYELLNTLSPQVPGPTVYVTHSPDDARRLAESVLVLEGGRLTTGQPF